MNASSAAAVEGCLVAAISSRAVAGISVSGVGEREAENEGDEAGFVVFDDFALLDGFDVFDGFVSDVFDFLVGGCGGGDDESDESEEEIGSGLIRTSSINGYSNRQTHRLSVSSVCAFSVSNMDHVVPFLMLCRDCAEADPAESGATSAFYHYSEN